METEKRASCSGRLALALSLRGMKQSELCARTGIPKSAVSQYISGEFKPKQDRGFLIAQALNVDEAWLMGYDVPMEPAKNENSPAEPELNEGERVLLDLFRRVPEEQQQLVLDMIRAALGSPK